VRAVIVGLILLLTGCSTLGPVHIVCKGKGTLAFQGGPYAGSVQGDCGDGFEYHRQGENDK
jgi:hypothetical protein